MGRKGWAGSPPLDDADARGRIVDAALTCIQRQGTTHTTLSDVSDVLGITRRTVYRYFSSTEDLFTAAAEVAYIIERLPDEPLLRLLLENDRTNQFSRRMLAPPVITRCRTILLRSRIDWAAMGYNDPEIDELIEFLLRIIQSMVIAPADPARDKAALRAFLHRWVGPALTAAR